MNRIFNLLWRPIIIVLIIVIFSASNFELFRNFQNKPVDSTYLGATGFYFDYYQFLSWMRDGSRGNILISSRYIPEIEKPVLLHPFFPVLGFLSQAAGLSLPITYHLARNVFLGLYLFSLYLLSKAVFAQAKYQKWSYLSILTASAFPYIGILNGRIFLSPMIDFWQTFYSLQKFDIPVHHLLSKSLFVILVVLMMKGVKRDPSTTLGMTVKIVLVSTLLVLVNPASMTFLLGVLITSVILSRARLDEGSLTFAEQRRGFFTMFRMTTIILLSILPFALYYLHVFQYGNPWQYYYLGEKVGRYLVPFRYYLGSLGPFFLTSLLSLVYFRKMRTGEKLMALWNFLPVFMFPFVGKQIPFSMSRLFSIDTFIPSSILTVFFFQTVNSGSDLKRLKGLTLMTLKGILVLLLIATIFGGYYSVRHVFNYKVADYYNVFLPQNLVWAVDYINNNTHKKSTILAGENISNLLPAVTDNHVVWGRQDAYRDYKGVEKQINEIYLRLVPDDIIMERLRLWRVQYIIFGIDHVRFEEFTKKGKINGIEEVFRNGEIVVGEVN